MRLKAPEGRGNPVIRGIEIKPNSKGVYDVDTADGRHLVEAFGYIDVDAPPKVAAPTGVNSAALRDGVLGALKHLGVAVPADYADARIADVLVDSVKEHVAGVSAKIKAAEDAVRAELAKGDGKDGKTA
jgi:hypothetical protein